MDLLSLPSEILARIASQLISELECPLAGVCVTLDEALREALQAELAAAERVLSEALANEDVVAELLAVL